MVVVAIRAPGLTPLPIAGWLALGYEALVKCIDGLVQGCTNSSPLEMELLQSHAKSSLYLISATNIFKNYCILDVGKLVIIALCNGFDIIWGHRFEAD